MDNLQQFLNLAGMGETQLGQDGEWGLTQVTAHDEMLLLTLLTAANPVLDAWLALVPALPDGPRGQLGGMGRHGRHTVRRDLAREERLAARCHRLAHQQHRRLHRARQGLHDGGAVGQRRHDDDEQYGINTIEDVARLVQHDLNNAKLTAVRSDG